MKAKLSASTIRTLQPGEKPFEVVDPEVKGFLLRVQPSGQMTYYFSYRTRDGRRRRYRIGNSYSIRSAQARDQAILLAARVIAGEDIQAEKERERAQAKIAKARTLTGFLTHRYEPWAATHRKSGQATVHRIRHNFAHLMTRPLGEISVWVIEKWRAQQLKSGKTRTTINRDVTALKACLSKAVEWDVIEENPLHKLRPLSTDKLSRVRYLTGDEEQALRDALIAREVQLRDQRRSGNAWRRERRIPELPDLSSRPFVDYLRPMTLLSLNTGLRQGELLNMRWTDVDLHRCEITVRADNAKSGKVRYMPLNQEAHQTLRDWKPNVTDSELVFPGPRGAPMTGIKTSWRRVLGDAGIRDFRWHDLRHHFASRLAMEGVDLNTLRELLGHADISMTLRYAHLSPEHKADAVARLCDRNQPRFSDEQDRLAASG